MKGLLKNILLRVLLLLLILAIPIASYIFIEDDAQLTWSINNIKEMNKYTIIAEFFPEKEELEVTERVQFVNKTNKSIDKVFFYINSRRSSNEEIAQDYADEIKLNKVVTPYEVINIESVDIKNKKANFKIIGKNKELLMVNLDKKLEENESVDIEIKYSLLISYLATVTNEGQNKYILNSWYPVIAKYENGWELTPTYSKSNLNEDTSYFIVEVIVPEEFEVETSGRLIERTKRREKYYFKFQDKGTLSFNVNIISTKY